MRVGGLERLLGLLVPAHLGQRLHERRGRPEHAQAAGVGVARARGRRVGHGVLERAGPEARLRPEHQQRADAVVGLRPAGLVDRLGEDPLGVLEPVGDRHVVHGEPDDDDQDRVALERLHRPLREVGGVRGRLAAHRHLHGGDRELQGAVELAVLDALAHPGGALVHRAPRVDGEARHAQHVAPRCAGPGPGPRPGWRRARAPRSRPPASGPACRPSPRACAPRRAAPPCPWWSRCRGAGARSPARAGA